MVAGDGVGFCFFVVDSGDLRLDLGDGNGENDMHPLLFLDASLL